MERERTRAVLQALGDKADLEGIRSLSEEERTALLPFSAYAVISNGGFRYFFEHDPADGYLLSDVAGRLRLLGLASSADACERVVRELFPGGTEPTSYKERRPLVKHVEWDRFRPELLSFYEVSWDRITDAIGEYVECHPGAF